MDQAALIALGANRPSPAGPPEATLKAALAALAAVPGLQLQAASRMWRTPAFPPGSGPDFANAAASFTCALSPEELLAVLHRIEAAHSRTRKSRWAARSLDLDLLALGDVVLPSAAVWRHWHDLPLARQQEVAPGELILPHPRMQDRAFVLAPLAEVAPDWRHPVLGLSVAEMLAACPAAERAEISPL